MTCGTGERGVALLSVLLIIGLMAVVSAAMLDRIVVAGNLAGNAALTARADGYAQAVETIARVRISDGLRGGQLPSGWRERPMGFRVPDGVALARIDDAGNCLNVNSVVEVDRATGETRAFPAGIEQFANLTAMIGIPRDRGVAIATALADWIDRDSVALPGGSERGSSALAGVLPANRLLSDPSEIVAIEGVTPEISTRLLPWLCALPTGGLSPINIDTLPPERAELLAMVARRGLSLAAARTVLRDRPAQGYQTLVTFWSHPAFARADLPDGVRAQPRVTPRWFDLRITVQLAGTEWNNQVLIDGEESPARVIHRRRFEP